MANPAQWPSFDNWSLRYAEYAFRRIRLLQAVAIFIQRKWRQRNQPRSRQRLYPICVDGRVHAVRQCVETIAHGERMLDKPVCCHEKLDGTNLGVRCDGAIFGRRLQVMGNTYQSVPLEGILPETATVLDVKKELVAEGDTSCAIFQLLLYGELMCNADRYNYEKRGMGKRWYAFGALLQIQDRDAAASICQTLITRGFWATMTPDGRKVTLRLNIKLSQLLTGHSVPCTPFLGSGPLKEVCLSLRDQLMRIEDMEGVVITASDFLVKWKTAKEDESKGHNMLVSLTQEYSNCVLKMCHIDCEMIEILTAVSNRDLIAAKARGLKAQIKGKKNTTDAAPCDAKILCQAYESALTKYNTLTSFFELGRRDEVTNLLIQEIAQDLYTDGSDQMKCVCSFVKKQVGRAYGAWLKKNQCQKK
eukprot:scaffold4743_cov171-Amphora_coffeaeformis.AAC.4